MATITIHAEDEKLKSLKAFLKALNMPFKEEKTVEIPPHVLEHLKISKQQASEGKLIPYTGVNNLLAK